MYDEGNFIEATEETSFFQIGETKYGKPIIDRVIHADTVMMEAVKCILVSFDSTMRSNIAVGCPLTWRAARRTAANWIAYITSPTPITIFPRSVNAGVRVCVAYLHRYPTRAGLGWHAGYMRVTAQTPGSIPIYSTPAMQMNNAPAADK
jgi:hypothetical protein